MSSVQQTVIALDVGTVRVGVAQGNTSVGFAHPLKTIATANFAQDFAKVINELKPDCIVVGLPRNLEGNDTPQTDFVRTFTAQHLAGAMVVYQDEALTSVKAAEELATRGGTHVKGDVDALAATYILQDYFDAIRRGN